MPLKSKRQMRWMYWAEEHGQMPKGSVKKWRKHTKNIKKLPEKVSKSEIENWIARSSELAKMAQPAPTFPHLKLKEDKSSVALATTPRQQEIGERSIVQHKNIWMNKYNEWAKQNSPDKIDDKKYSYPQDKDTRAPKGVAFGGPYGRTAMAQPDKPTPTASNRLITQEAYKKGKYHTFFEPNSTIIHETLHDNFGRVHQQYGLPARLNLAHNLYHSLPKQYKYTADSLYALSPTDNTDPHGLKDHWIHEEKLARLGDYLNDRSYRKKMMGYLGPSDPKNHTFDNDAKAAHKAMLHAAKIAHKGWLDKKLYDDSGKFVGKAEYLGDLEELEKGWKSSIIGAGATLAALGSQVKPVGSSTDLKPSISQARAVEKPIAKPTEAPKALVASIPTKQAPVAEPVKKTHSAHVFEGLDPDLNFISHLESNHGKYLDHEKNSKGEFHTAFGHLGFKPVSAYEVYSKTKQLKDKYPNLDTNDKFLTTFKSDPKFYNDVASTFWNKMKKRLGSPEKTAFGWRHGLGAALKATQEDFDNDGYTQKYKDMYAHGDIHKSELELLSKVDERGFARYYDASTLTPRQVMKNWRDNGDKARERSYLVPIEHVWPHREYQWSEKNHRAGSIPNPDKNSKIRYFNMGGNLYGHPDTVNTKQPEYKPGSRWHELKNHMSKYGWDVDNPAHINVGKNGGIKVGEGNHRLAIAKELGITHVPVMYHHDSEVSHNAHKYVNQMPKEILPKLDLSHVPSGPDWDPGDIHKSEDFGQTLTHWVQDHTAPTDPLESKFEDSKDKYDIAQQMVVDKFRDWDEILKVAQFLGGVQEVPEELVNEATEKYPDNPYFAALYACKLPQDENTKKALVALLSKNEPINKSENEAKLPEGKDIKPYCIHGEDIAQLLQKAFQNKTVKHIDLHGKHSKNALLATDQDTGRVYLLKPDDHKLSPALGVADTSANQPVREAVFYHIAKAAGLVNYFPRAEAISIDDSDWAAIKLLPKDFQTVNTFCGGDLTKLQQVLRPYLDSGVLYKLAAIDLVLGQVDRHSSNGMISKDGRLVLIDQGSGLAGQHFNPGKDKNSYIPFYLRIFTSKDFKKKDHIAKLKELPKLDPKIDKIVKDWINSINPNTIIIICDEYKINPQPFLERLARLQNWKGLIYTAINRMWCSL